MSLGQKCVWGQLVIFGGLVIGWLVLFISRGTVFYWQNESMMMIFYVLSGSAFVLLVMMNLWASFGRNRKQITSDERDKSIFRKASLWATGISYTVVALLLLAVAITYMNLEKETISVYFPLFIVLIGGVTLLLTQAVAALILYNKKVRHDES
jgi:hypothetical protein